MHFLVCFVNGFRPRFELRWYDGQKLLRNHHYDIINELAIKDLFSRAELNKDRRTGIRESAHIMVWPFVCFRCGIRRRSLIMLVFLVTITLTKNM